MIKEEVIYKTPYPSKVLLPSISIAVIFIIYALFSGSIKFVVIMILIQIVVTWLFEILGGVSISIYKDAITFNYPARLFRRFYHYSFLSIDKILITTSDKYQATNDFKIMTKEGKTIMHEFFFISKKEIQTLIDQMRNLGIRVEIKSIGTVFFK